MKLLKLIVLGFFLLSSFFIPHFVLAEAKIDSSFGASGGIIPKLPKTPNDPELFNGHVYPNWGPVCQRYTYSVVYRDKEGRKPEYVKIYFNGKMIEMEKQNPNDNDYKKGVRYIYKVVPNKLGSNFYYFEASNGLGRTRASIIDSPDNGPVLFASPFDKNEIAVVDRESGKKILSFSTDKEWIGGVALSGDGRYLAAKSSKHIYFFDTTRPDKPFWTFNCEQCRVGDDVKGGIDISADGSKIIAAIGERIVFFDKSSNKPIWKYDKSGNAYNVAISKNGKYMAAATAGEESNVESNLLILWNDKSEKPLWQYHSSGNFHDVSLSDDGNYIAGSTGCPDRRAYLFSKESNTPLVKTDSLTRDSPVHRAKVSSDGSFFAVGSESDAGAVFLFSKNSKDQIWKFPTISGSSVRALSFTPDGKYIGAATFGGNAYIFDSQSPQPLSSWVVNDTALGGIDIADDGSFIATGGTDNRLHIFEKNSQKETEIPFNEYVEEIDISANGRYIAAGTGGSVYFFETFTKDESPVVCSSIIEPKEEEEMRGESGEQVTSSLCGDGRCEGPETIDNCRRDCDSGYKGKQNKLPGMMFGFGFIGTIIALVGYLATVKSNLLRKPVGKMFKLDKKIVITLAVLSTTFLLLTLISLLINRPPEMQRPPIEKESERQEIQPKSPEGESSVCGNDICEPGLGETKAVCPQDCSAGD